MTTTLCPRAMALRPMPRTFSVPRKTAFSTKSTTTTTALRPSITCRIPPTTTPTISHRPSSTTTTTTPPSPQQQPPPDLLTWNRFFDLRRKRRYINLASSLLTAAGSVAIFAPILAQQDIDSWGAQVSGMDPMIVMGVSVMAVGAGGWLCGPSFGSAGFGVWAARRGWGRAIVEKEKNFYRRIKTNRADPTASSPQNPIPDYYGEKIGSVRDYRRWLKDQRAFNRKKNKDLI